MELRLGRTIWTKRQSGRNRRAFEEEHSEEQDRNTIDGQVGIEGVLGGLVPKGVSFDRTTRRGFDLDDFFE